jgi:hypothetical protein
MSAYRTRRAMLVVAFALAAFTVAAPARADTVTDWNSNASDAVHVIGGQGAPSIAHLAMVHLAMYDAVNAIDRRHKPYLTAPRARWWYSKDAAAATAAYKMLVDPRAPLVGTTAQLASVVALIQPRYDTALAAIPDGPAKAGGIAAGDAAAEALILARMGDGRFGPFRFTVGTVVPQWRPEPAGSTNDPGAWLKDVRPFLVRDSSQFAGAPPLALTSRRYAKEYNEVKDLGAVGSTTRTADQQAAAEFWGRGNATNTWGALLRDVAQRQGGSTAGNARLFAMAYTTAADALITTWADKARYSFWRPLTAIHQVNPDDGNPNTVADTGWTPLINAPPYPEHPSGLSALGAAIARSLQDFYGTDKATFGTTTTAGFTRSYHRFSQAASEIVDARVWSGIHFRHGDEQGARIGEQVARWGNRRHFRAIRHHGHHHGHDH